MAGIGDSWGTEEELLHPRGPDGRWIRAGGIAKSIIGAVMDALANFSRSHRSFQNRNQATQYLQNIASRQGRSRMRREDHVRLARDLGPANADLRDGVIDEPSTKTFVQMMDRSKVELPDSLILTRTVGVDAFGFTPETANGTNSDTDPGIRGLAGKLVADRGYGLTTVDGPHGSPPPGTIRMVIAAPKGTKAIIPGAGPNDPTVMTDRGQPVRITKVKPDGAGGWIMYGLAESEGGGDVPEPMGGPLGPGREKSKDREARIRETQQSLAKVEKVPDEQKEQEAEAARAAERAKMGAPVPSPQQEAERRRVEQITRQPAPGEPPPRTEPVVGRVGEAPAAGAPAPVATPAAGTPEPTPPPVVPGRIVDLRLAVRDAKIPAPSRGKNRQAFNEAYLGVAEGKKDPIDAVRELDSDIAGLRGERKFGEERVPDETRAADADALQQLRDVIAKEYGLEQSAPAKKATKAVPRTGEAGLPKQEGVVPVKKVAKKAAGPPPTEGPMRIGEARRRSAIDAVHANEISGEGSVPYERIRKNLEEGTVTVPGARQDALKTAKYWHEQATRSRDLGRATPEERRRIHDKNTAIAARYEQLAEALTESQSVTKTDKYTRGLTAKKAAAKAAKKAAPAKKAVPGVEGDLDRMTKAELLAEAEKRDAKVTKSWTKDKIKAALRGEAPEPQKRAPTKKAPAPVSENETQIKELFNGRKPTMAQLRSFAKEQGFQFNPKDSRGELISTILGQATPRRGLGRVTAPSVPAPAKKAAPRTPFNAITKAEEVSAVMIGAPGRERVEQGMKAMEDLNLPQLRQVAKELGIGVPGPGRDEGKTPEALREFIARNLDSFGTPGTPPTLAPAKKAAVPGAAPGTAAGKITAGRLKVGDQVLVSRNNDGTWSPSSRKTGQTRLTIENIGRAQGRGGFQRSSTRLILTGRDENGNEIQVASVPGHQTFIVAPEPGAAPAKKAAKAVPSAPSPAEEKAQRLVPEGSVPGVRTDTPVDNAPRKRELRQAWIAADIQPPPGPVRAQTEEIRDKLFNGEITPEESIRMMEAEIALNKEDLAELDAHLREADLTDPERREFQGRAAKLIQGVEEQEKASKFLRLYFKEEAPVVSLQEAKVQDPEAFEFLKGATPDDMREAAKLAGLDAPGDGTPDEMFRDLIKQVAKKELDRRAAKKAAKKVPAKTAKKAAPAAVPADKERVDARLLAEGIDGISDQDIADLQRFLDGEAVPGSGKNPTPARISQYLDFQARGVENSTAIRHGSWSDLSNPESPRFDAEYAEQQRQAYQRGMARVRALQELSGRVRVVRRRSFKKAAPAKVAPEVRTRDEQIDDLQKRIIDNALTEMQGTKSRDKADDALEGLTMPELRRLAEQSGIKPPRTKRGLRDAILDRFMGPEEQVTLASFEGLPSRDAAAAIVAPLGKADLLRLAKELSVPGASGKNMTELRREIVEGTTGLRLDSIATRGFTGIRPGFGDVTGKPDIPEGPRGAAATPTRSLSARARDAGIEPPGRTFSGVDSGVSEADRRLKAGQSPVEVSRFLRERAAQVAKADLNEEGRRFTTIQDKQTLQAIRKQSAEYLRRVGTHVQQEGKGRTAAKKAAPAAPRAPDAPSASRTGTSPVGGTKSTTPEIKNNWGMLGTGGDVEFHPDGVAGTELERMGDDRLMDVGGEPLSNVVGKLATRAIRGQISQEQLLNELRQLEQKLPGGSRARRGVASMVKGIDAPKRAMPDLPEGLPTPFRRAMESLLQIPLAREAVDRPGFHRSREDSEVDKLLKLIQEFQEGRTGGLRMISEIQDMRRHLPHESQEGRFEADRALRRLHDELQNLYNDKDTRIQLMPKRS